MPTTPRTTRYSIYARRGDDTNIGSESTPMSSRPGESTGVQDRIRQWQAQGAAGAPAPDALSVRSIPLSHIDHIQARADSPSRNSLTEVKDRRRGRRKDIAEEPSENKARSQSSPRKRIISDEHWRAKSNEKKASIRKRETKQKPASKYDLTYTSNTIPENDAQQRQRRRKSQPAAAKINDEAVTGVQLGDRVDLDISKRQRRRVFSYEEEHEIPSPNSLQFDDRITIHPGQSVSPGLEEVPLPASRKKGRNISRSKDLFTKSDSVLMPSNRLPSVEAWLHEQPDPFVDSTIQYSVEPVEIPRPLRKRSKRPTISDNTARIGDPNSIWESIDRSEAPPAYEGRVNESSPKVTHRSRESRKPLRTKATNNSRTPDESQLQVEDLKATLTPTGGNEDTEIRDSRSSETMQSIEASNPTVSDKRQRKDRESRRKWRDRPLPALPLTADALSPSNPEIPSDPNEMENCRLKRKLTTHEDLMSVLSLPSTGKKVKSARSMKQARTIADHQSLQELLLTLKADEEKYSRELRTLIDGVIPVLLQCVLSKTSSMLAANLFTSPAGGNDHMNVTRPIIDMGIALERLKSLHNRIPLQNVDQLLAWGQSARKAYTDYLQSWRLGFHDVIVNLAPLKDGEDEAGQMSRDSHGDVIDGEGKKVDVAYLLKRPLVRVKNLAKTFDSITKQSETRLATEVLQIYTELTDLARRRHQEEQARLEDEAASTLDSLKVRDIRTLSPMTSIVVDSKRKVRARDCFNLTLYHSNGQRIDCKIEMILRDDPSSNAKGGDVLICELDNAGKWLLFQPIEISAISARRGENDFDLVVMIRGPAGLSRDWQELLALKADIPEAASEWLNMLGSNPLPPKLNRNRSFLDLNANHIAGAAKEHSDLENEVKVGLDEVDIPLGEPSIISSHANSRNLSPTRATLLERFIPRLGLGGGLQRKPRGLNSSAETIFTQSANRSTNPRKPKYQNPLAPKSASVPTTPTHKNVSISKLAHNVKLQPDSRRGLDNISQPGSFSATSSREASPTRRNDKVQLNTKNDEHDKAGWKETTLSPIDLSKPDVQSLARPGYDQTKSPIPAQELTSIRNLRTLPTPPDTSSSTPLRSSTREQWDALSGIGTMQNDENATSRNRIHSKETSPSPSHLVQGIQDLLLLDQEGRAPVPPPHREMSMVQLRSSDTPSREQQPKLKMKKVSQKAERSSSPLKHEYAPSTASEYDGSSDSDGDSDSSSETSDSGSECEDLHTPLVTVTAGGRRGSRVQQEQYAAPESTATRTLAPSDSASQGPYRKVPPSTAVPSAKQFRAIALVCSWSDRGMWEQIYPDECSIVISPGLIEAFEMSEAHSGIKNQQSMSGEQDSRSSSLVQQPIVAFELTPIVPLRKGTALDISIRSLPTPNSQIRTTNNVLFRARTAEECDKLYNLINWARCNNPTYIQLQNARPDQTTVNFNFANLKKKRGKGGWFGFGGLQRKSSYRAAPYPTAALPSIDGSDAPATTMMSTFSALKRLGASSAFNINRSSVVRKNGSSRGGSSLYSSSNGTRPGSGASTPVPSQAGYIPGKDGPNTPLTSAAAANGGGMVNNMKIRVYMRKGQQWENLGAGRLSVLPAPNPSQQESDNSRTSVHVTGPHDSPSTMTPISRAPTSTIYGKPQESPGPRLPSASHTPHRIHGNGREKRVLIVKNKEPATVLLDAVLGESCFERIMQTGIAVKVWSEDEHIGHTGGVVMGREKIYMMQFPGTKEAGWVFQMCGTYRYGD